MMAALMQLQIITPDRALCDMPVGRVRLRTAEGEMTVLPKHIPLTVMMVPGVVEFLDEDNHIRKAAVHDGFVEIQPDRVTIMAEIAEWPEDIDLERAKKALARARERITSPGPDTDMARARRAWNRAKARIETLAREEVK